MPVSRMKPPRKTDWCPTCKGAVYVRCPQCRGNRVVPVQDASLVHDVEREQEIHEARVLMRLEAV